MAGGRNRLGTKDRRRKFEKDSAEKPIKMLTKKEKKMKKKKTFYLHDLTYEDVAAYLKKCDVAMVPMGSIERHGAHIPLGCDALTTWEVVRRAADKASVIYAPISPFGY